jgi:type I restriction-modification system DNA methylase subunit
MDYSPLSKELTGKLSKQIKKQHGIYFTPPSFVKRNVDLLKPYLSESSRVLEPSCGSCEYITALRTVMPSLHITGIEYNKDIYESIDGLNDEQTRIILMDFLKYDTKDKYDCILGNTPYYVIKKSDVDPFYYPYFTGRPNIFIPFIIKSAIMLKDGGILSFILPKNFLNCLYYENTRIYIANHFQILHIIECCDKYIDTQQDTVLLIVQKNDVVNNISFVMEKHSVFVLVESHATIKQLYKNSKSLAELGSKVSVGTLVWNQHKQLLTDDTTKTRLIYSSDIKNGKLLIKKYTNADKKNYIHKDGIRRPMIVLNRGYGVGEYKFNYCLLNEPYHYLIENHLICIESVEPRENLLDALQKIISSFEDPRTTEFIKLYFGNNAINTTELNHILPLYQDI